MNNSFRGALVALCAFVLFYAVSALFLYISSDKKAQDLSLGFPVPHITDVPAWERKKSVEGETLKVGLITDTHLDSKRVVPKGDPLVVKIPAQYEFQLDQFVDAMKEFQPKFLVHLGDVIEGTKVDQKVGIIEIGLIRDAIAKADITTYWAVGNHDLRSVTRRDFQNTVSQDGVNKVIDEGPYRIILLDPNYRPDGTPGHPMSGDFVPGFIPKETIAWLEKVLDTDQRVYIFAHHSFVPEPLTLKGPVSNHEEVRALFTKYNVDAVFDGHIEKRFFTELDGVEYYMFPGTKKSPLFQGAYYAMTLVGEEPEIRMYYMSPGEMEQVKEEIKENEKDDAQEVDEYDGDLAQEEEDAEEVEEEEIEELGEIQYIEVDFMDGPFTEEEMIRQRP